MRYPGVWLPRPEPRFSRGPRGSPYRAAATASPSADTGRYSTPRPPSDCHQEVRTMQALNADSRAAERPSPLAVAGVSAGHRSTSNWSCASASPRWTWNVQQPSAGKTQPVDHSWPGRPQLEPACP